MHFGDVSETKRQKTLSDHVTRSAVMSLVVQVHLTTGKKTSVMSDSTVNFLFPIFIYNFRGGKKSQHKFNKRAESKSEHGCSLSC